MLYGECALRVILLGYRDFDYAPDWEDEDAVSRDITISAIVGIQVIRVHLKCVGFFFLEFLLFD